MPVDKKAVLLKALAEIKALSRQMKGDGMKAKYGPPVSTEADEPDEGTPAEEETDAAEGGEPGEMPPEPGAMPEESLDEDKIAQLVAMLGKK